MLYLKFLEFDNVMISSNPRILPNSLRSITWGWYPSKFLPSGFQPNFLITLEMPQSKLVQLWDGRKDLPNLKRMDLFGSIRQLPRSIVGLTKLYKLDLGGSGSQLNKSWFRWGLPRLYERKAFVLPSLDGLLSLRKLDLSNCGVCEGDIPNDFGCMSALEELKLSGNNFVSLPASIGCLSKLKLFRVNGCQRLQQLPDLSKLISLVTINIAGCTSLKMSPHLSSNCSLVDINSEIHPWSFNCANCFVSVHNEGCDSIILKMLQRYLQLIPRPLFGYKFEIVTPGREIPEWFSNQSLGDSLTVELPLDSCTTWIGIALCAVFEVQADRSKFHGFIISCSPQGMWQSGFSNYFEIGDVVSDHLWVIYVPREQFKTKCGQIKVLLTTYYLQDGMWVRDKSCESVKKCGFRLVHEQDVEQLNQIMMNKSIIKSATTCTTKSADAQGQQRHDDEEAGSSHQKPLFCNTHVLSEEADQDELNDDDDDDVVDEARPRKRKKIYVFGTDL